MSNEILAFANFIFEIRKTTTKVIVGDGIQEEERFSLNWPEYVEHLQERGIRIVPESRAFFKRYQAPKPDLVFFNDFERFQNEFRKILDEICEGKAISLESWQTIFREAERIGEMIIPNPAVKRPVSESDLQELSFEKHITAETYRAFLFGQLRDLIVGRKLFRLRKCPECGVYFFDNTKNGSKIYCNAQLCGNRAKQRQFQKRQSRADANQGSLFKKPEPEGGSL